MGTVMFFLLSMLTGIIEVGAALYAISQGYSILHVLLLVFAYQLGCFFPTNITLKKPFIVTMGIISLVLAVICFFAPSIWFLLTSVLLASPCLQYARSLHKRAISTGLKRVFRILGFAVSPLFNPLILAVIATIVTATVVLSKKNDDNKLTLGYIPPHYLIMIVHQMHYFSYAYFILVIANNFDSYKGFVTALIFVLGWITYTSAQYIFRGEKYATYLIGGHIFLVILLVAMIICDSALMKVLLWILTGFGGGTVFCIKELLKLHGKHNSHSLETSENYGHVLGVFAAIVLYAIFNNVNAPILFASICATATVQLVLSFRLT